MKLLSNIWGVLTPRQRRGILFAQILSVMMAFSTVAGIASVAPFFAVLGDPRLIVRSPILHSLYQLGFSSDRSFIVALGLAFVGLVLFANLLNVVGTFVMARLAYSIVSDMQCILFAEYVHRPYVFHARTQSALLYNNVIQETARSTNQILQSGLSLVTNVITTLLIAASVMLLNPTVAAAMLVVMAGGYGLIYLTIRHRLLRAGHVQSRQFVQLTQMVNESLGAIKEIIVLRKQDFFRESFTRASREFAHAGANTLAVSQSPRYVMESVAVVGLVTVALLARNGEYGLGAWLGQLTFIGFSAYRLLPALQQAFAAVVRIRSEMPGFTAIAPDLRLARQRTQASVAADPDPAWQDAPRSEIHLQEVSFCYTPDRPSVINGATLTIPARAAVGLVGANGSGKTTLVDLIAGLLVPSAGQIEVDGVALNDSNRTAWQSRIAYVPQNIVLLDTSIAQNIALGVPKAAIDRERLLSVARLAQLDQVVEAFPEGYEYIVGERGVRLSGGQRQRIGIARALYAQASVLILDEATNALDGLTEHELMSTIVRLRGHYTIVLIAHRLSTVRACDVIFELDRGKVVASGGYDSLVRTSVTFRRWANIA